MAYAGAEWTDALLRAMNGEKDVSLFTFVESPLYADKGVPYFSSKVTLTAEGTVGQIHDVGKITESEQKLLDACLPDLAGNIKKGVQFIAK